MHSSISDFHISSIILYVRHYTDLRTVPVCHYTLSLIEQGRSIAQRDIIDKNRTTL